MTDRDGNGRYDKLLLQTVEGIRSDVAEGRRESAEFRAETTARLAALDVRVEKLDEHMSEDARKNRRLAIKAGAVSGAVRTCATTLN